MITAPECTKAADMRRRLALKDDVLASASSPTSRRLFGLGFVELEYELARHEQTCPECVLIRRG